MFKKNSKKWLVLILITIGAIPILITAFEVVFTLDKSVVFMGNYHPKIAILVISYYILLLGLGIFWFTSQLIAINRLKNEKAKTELTLLKSQINPHFFFNVLNNLYGLVAKDPKKSQVLILKLSDIMRYSIYEGEKDRVSLAQEVEYLMNYIELHKMRYHKNIIVNFSSNIEADIKVAPLLFIMLLENSFKHGVEKLRTDAYVNLEIASNDGTIQFLVENNYETVERKDNKSGIGLKNLRQRLELIYPDKHNLSFSITENVYKAKLVLNQ